MASPPYEAHAAPSAEHVLLFGGGAIRLDLNTSSGSEQNVSLPAQAAAVMVCCVSLPDHCLSFYSGFSWSDRHGSSVLVSESIDCLHLTGVSHRKDPRGK
jgi:hypothetical protein